MRKPFGFRRGTKVLGSKLRHRDQAPKALALEQRLPRLDALDLS